MGTGEKKRQPVEPQKLLIYRIKVFSLWTGTIADVNVTQPQLERIKERVKAQKEFTMKPNLDFIPVASKALEYYIPGGLPLGYIIFQEIKEKDA